MNILENNIIKQAMNELEKLRFIVGDPAASKEIEQSAIELDLSIEDALHIDRTIRINHIEALTALAKVDESGLCENAIKVLNSIESESRALERTAIWTGA